MKIFQAQSMMEMERQVINDAFLITLFQIMKIRKNADAPWRSRFASQRRR
jgi:hypothetical protein